MRERRTRWLTGAALGVILVVAAWLRIPSHDWDQDQHLHTDERYVTRVAIDRVQFPPGVPLAAYLDPQRSPIDPRVHGALYTYGALPLYLGKAATVAALAVSGDSYFSSYDGMQQTGRVVAGLIDVLTTLLVFAIGVRLWGRGAGLLAAALYALAVLATQIAHFYISEPFMSAFITASVLGSIGYVQTRRVPWLLLGGFCAGLAMACKLSAAPVLVVPVLAALILDFGSFAALKGTFWILDRTCAFGAAAKAATPEAQVESDSSSKRQGPKARSGWRVGGVVLLVVLAAGLGLLLGDPFAVLDAPTYLAQVRDQALIQSGVDDQAWTRQYVGTWPVIYPWGQLVLLGAGPLVGLAGTWGLLDVRRWRAGWRAGTRGAAALLLPAGMVAYFASIAFLDAKWLRYVLPLVPGVCLLAAMLAVEGAGVLGRRVRLALAGLLLATALGGAAAFQAIYARPHARVEASEWAYAHIPAGARIGLEVGDDPMPRKLAGRPAPDTTYPPVWMDLLADHPPAEESRLLRGYLGSVDYLVISSTRIRDVVPHLPWRYPVQARYYDLLFQGRLGFRPVLTVTSYPTLFGLALPDAQPWIDTTFTVYDHPPVWVFQRTAALDPGAWDSLFAAAVQQPWQPSRRGP